MPQKVSDKSREVQLSFIESLKSSIPANISLVDEIADILAVSNDSAYRRMRGETPLTIDELDMLCRHFKVPFDTQVQKDVSIISFNYRRLEGKYENFVRWLQNLRNDVERISGVPGSKIIYAADDVPIWHHFINDEFIAFKFFYWLKCIMNDEQYISAKFSADLIDSNLIKTAHELLEKYNNTHSVEIWTEDTLNSTLKQVEYFWESGFFHDKEQAFRVCNSVKDVINTLQQKVNNGCKGKSVEKNFEFYVSDVMVGNNTILVYLGNAKVAYVSNNTFNFLSTGNAAFVEENETWLNNLIKKSTLISGVSEKQRIRYFNQLHHKVDAIKQKIERG